MLRDTIRCNGDARNSLLKIRKLLSPIPMQTIGATNTSSRGDREFATRQALSLGIPSSRYTCSVIVPLSSVYDDELGHLTGISAIRDFLGFGTRPSPDILLGATRKRQVFLETSLNSSLLRFRSYELQDVCMCLCMHVIGTKYHSPIRQRPPRSIPQEHIQNHAHSPVNRDMEHPSASPDALIKQECTSNTPPSPTSPRAAAPVANRSKTVCLSTRAKIHHVSSPFQDTAQPCATRTTATLHDVYGRLHRVACVRRGIRRFVRRDRPTDLEPLSSAPPRVFSFLEDGPRPRATKRARGETPTDLRSVQSRATRQSSLARLQRPLVARRDPRLTIHRRPSGVSPSTPSRKHGPMSLRSRSTPQGRPTRTMREVSSGKCRTKTFSRRAARRHTRPAPGTRLISASTFHDLSKIYLRSTYMTSSITRAPERHTPRDGASRTEYVRRLSPPSSCHNSALSPSPQPQVFSWPIKAFLRRPASPDSLEGPTSQSRMQAKIAYLGSRPSRPFTGIPVACLLVIHVTSFGFQYGTTSAAIIMRPRRQDTRTDPVLYVVAKQRVNL